jgi:hypothetical protein
MSWCPDKETSCRAVHHGKVVDDGLEVGRLLPRYTYSSHAAEETRPQRSLRRGQTTKEHPRTIIRNGIIDIERQSEPFLSPRRVLFRSLYRLV